MNESIKQRMPAKKNQKPLPSYARLVKGYMEFLTGTGKSLSTIGCYRGDLDLFEEYLRQKKKDFYSLQSRDFSAYQIWLEKQGLKTNTRRRKILSAKSLVKYAVSRKKLAPSNVQFVKAPERLERLPWIPLPSDWQAIEKKLSLKTSLALRNTIAVHLLAETGVTVAELCALRWDQVNGPKVMLEGKKPRELNVSRKLERYMNDWRKIHPGKHVFPGFNRHGITSEKMTTRGVELYFRVLGRESGYTSLKPKTLRHLAIANWLRENIPETEIQRRLGVHPSYSLDAYRKHLETC